MARISLVLLFLWSLVCVMDGQTLSGPPHGKVVVCYVASWAAYRPGAGKFELDNLDPSQCTHLVYSFAGLNETTNTIKSLDPWQDLEKDYGKAGYKRLVAYKERFPHLKVTIAIGGWNEGSPKYSKMASTPETRAAFIKSVMYFLDMYKFDGLDLDWEYPTRREGKPEDKANYVSLVKELKEAFEPRGYILTAAFGAGKETMEAAYDLAALSRHLTFIHMMCYDYHGTWDGVVGANAPLTSSDPNDFLTVEYTIKYMLAHGVSPYKMVLGLPMYGRTFFLEQPSNDVQFGVTRVKSTGFQGPWTKENGFMGYNEICTEISNSSARWRHFWHESSATPYLIDNDRVISYDNPRSIAAKVKLAMDYKLGGLMVWSIDTDDFLGNCAEGGAYVDFTDRYNKILEDPLLEEALKNLKLPDANRVENQNKRTAYYVVSNDKLYLRLPPPKYNKYTLMRTINEATSIAIEEKRIIDEMNRVVKQNEVETEPNSAVKSLGNVLICGCMFLLIFFQF